MKSYIRRYTQEETFNAQSKSLLILELIGLPIKKEGIKLYAEVLDNIKYFLNKAQNKNEVEELKGQLLNPYSQFYFDIARNDNDIGLKTFHALIKDSLPDSNTSKKNRCPINKDNYKELAFTLGKYISSKNNNKLNKQTKTHKLVKHLNLTKLS